MPRERRTAESDLVPAIRTGDLLALTHLKPSTLEYWILKGLVTPTRRGSIGHRYERLWDINDALTVRTIKALREAGCSLQRIRNAIDYLRATWDQTLAENVLYWDGSHINRIAPDGKVESVWTNPGQLIFRQFAELPIGKWRDELSDVVHLYRRGDLENRRTEGRGAIPIRSHEAEALEVRRRGRTPRSLKAAK